MSGEIRDLAGEYHRLLSPRIAALVTALRGDERPNTMVAAWHTPVSINPPILAVAIAPLRTSHDLIMKSEEFTLSIPDESMIKKVLVAGSTTGYGFDKSELFNYRKGQKIRTPIITEALGNIECTLNRVIAIGDHSVFFGNVVAASAREFKGVWLGSSPLLHLGDESYALMGNKINSKILK
jgi:flavin reductase (DIM6/NTAB) family NADH-FMN oxidoreductase RutF